MEADSLAANTTNCYNRLINFYFLEILTLQIRFHYGDTVDNIFNMTELVANVSNHMTVCTSSLENLYFYYQNKKLLFATLTDYFLAFFQNLLANVLNIYSVYGQLKTDSTTTPNRTDVFYQTGRLMIMLLDFEPLLYSPNPLSDTDYSVEFDDESNNEYNDDKLLSLEELLFR
jgi:hypothetical protein